MKFKIRVILKLFLILVTFIFCVRFYLVRKNLLLNYKLEEKKILSSYEDKKEKYDLVNSLLDDVLVQGGYIDIKKIPIDKIKYRIYNYNDNIIFSYNLKDEFSNSSIPFAKITLSNDCNVINEEYSKLESFEEYKEEYIKEANAYATVLSILPIFLGLILMMIVYCFVRQ